MTYRGNKKDDAALVTAVNRMARSLVRQTSFDYHDIAQEALLYVVQHDYQSEEHRQANAVLKCRSVFADEIKKASKGGVPLSLETTDLRPNHGVVTPSCGFYCQELHVAAAESCRQPLRESLKAALCAAGRGSQVVLAKRANVYPRYLNDFLSGRHDVRPDIAVVFREFIIEVLG